MSDFLDYSLWITPGCLLLGLLFYLLPKKTILAKVFILIFGFILVRDSMTRFEFWEFGVTSDVLWMRFIEDGLILSLMGLVSLVLALGLYWVLGDWRLYIQWWGKNRYLSVLAGISGAGVVIAPFIWLYQGLPVVSRGGLVPLNLLAVLLMFAISGNFLEELLFRGYLQGYLATFVAPGRAAILSALLFGAGHLFLAYTVTDLAWPVIVFTLYEGLICSLVGWKYGVLASTLTHGLAIFALASGIL